MKGLHTNVAYFGGTVAIAVLVMAFVVKATAWKLPVESWALARLSAPTRSIGQQLHLAASWTP